MATVSLLQIKEHEVLRADLDGKHQTLLEVKAATQQLLEDSQQESAALHKKLDEVDDRYHRIANRCLLWGKHWSAIHLRTAFGDVTIKVLTLTVLKHNVIFR